VTNFHLDQRPIQPQTSEQDIGKETQRLDTLVAKCKAGVAWVNLLAIAKQLQFGEYNDRLENDNETNKLIASFKGSGIVAMKDTSAIPLILDLKRIQPELTLAKDFVEVDQVPELKLIDTQKIIVASGQHRLSALRRYNKSLQDELDALEKRWKKISGLKNPTQEHVELHNDLRAEIGAMKGLLQGMNKWGVIVYDKGKLDAMATVSTASMYTVSVVPMSAHATVARADYMDTMLFVSPANATVATASDRPSLMYTDQTLQINCLLVATNSHVISVATTGCMNTTRLKRKSWSQF